MDGNLIIANPETFNATAFGLLFAFYKLKSAKPLWYFSYMYFWMGLPMYGAELPRFFGLGGVPWSPYLRPEEAGRFWHYWGYFFTDAHIIPEGLVAMYYSLSSNGKECP